MNDIIYEGKSKIICRGADENSLLIRYKDTATAFNGEKKAEIPGKGKCCAAISNIIFKYLAERGIKTHLLEIIDETTVLVKKTEIIPVEVIIRNISAGSFAKKYGISEGAELSHTVVEFSYKSDRLGDPMINESQAAAIGLATADELNEMSRQALKVNELLCEVFTSVGIRLVDFKLEFGRCGGEIILCDEISPDSCRLWDIITGEKLDKDLFRYELGDLTYGYSEALRRLRLCAE